MKHLKSFENRNYRYLSLSEEDKEKLKVVSKNWVIKHKKLEEINKLKFDDFKEEVFNYEFLWENIYSNGGYKKDGNIYYAIDEFCNKHKINGAPEIRNTTQEIMSELYYEFELEKIFDNRLIGLLKKYEKYPEKFKNEIEPIWNHLSKNVKDKYQWMIDFQKYNL